MTTVEVVESGPSSAVVRGWRTGPVRSSPSTVVLIHGINGCADDWRSVARLVNSRTGATMIAASYRGHGRSDRFGPYHLAGYVDDVVSVMHSAGVEKVHLVGASFGGPIAVEIARRLGPSRVLSVSAFGSAARFGTTHGGEEIVSRLKLLGVEGFFRAVMPKWTFAPSTHADIVDQAIEVASRNDMATVEAILRSVFGAGSVVARAQLGCPSVAVSGSLDRTCPPADGLLFAQRIGGRHIVLDGVGHMPMAENPEATAGIIVDMVASNDTTVVTS